MPIDIELFDELLKRAAQSPVASHTPVTDADVLRIQLADIDRERQAEMRPGSGPLLTGDPSQLNEALGSMIGQPSGAILAPNSMVRRPEVRSFLNRLLEGSAKQFPSHVQEAISDTIKRYPRLMSHITNVSQVEPQWRKVQGGAMTPSVAPNAQPRGVLEMNPDFPDYNSALRTIRHEAVHIGDMLREAAKARRSGQPDPTQTTEIPFNRAYKAEKDYHGYWDMPMEVRARTVEALTDIHRKDMPAQARHALAKDQAMRGTRMTERFENELGMGKQDLPSLVDEVIGESIAANRLQPSDTRVLRDTIRPVPAHRDPRQVGVTENTPRLRSDVNGLIQMLSERLRQLP